MSLARTLLNGSNEELISLESVDYTFGKATLDTGFLDTAMESLFEDIFKVDQAYHVADIIGEVKVLQEGADPQVLLEGIIKDGIDKIVAAFKKFWAKLKDWFAQVKKFFKSFFLTGKKFVKEFEKEIQEKEAKGFKYRAFKYDFAKGDSAFDKIRNIVDKEVQANINACASGNKLAAAYAKNDNQGYDTEKIKGDVKAAKGELYGKMADELGSTADYEEKIIKSLGLNADNTSELKEKLGELYRGGETEKSEFENFESNSKKEMLNVVGNEKFVSDVEKDEKKYEKGLNDVIKALESIKSKENEAAYKMAQHYSKLITKLLNIAKSASDEKVSVYKEAAGSFRGILGAFVRYKPAKEGVDMSEEEDGMEEGCGGKKSSCESLMEMAYNLL